MSKRLDVMLFGKIRIEVDESLADDEFRLGRSLCDLRGVVAKGGRVVPLMRATAPIMGPRKELADGKG